MLLSLDVERPDIGLLAMLLAFEAFQTTHSGSRIAIFYWTPRATSLVDQLQGRIATLVHMEQYLTILRCQLFRDCGFGFVVSIGGLIEREYLLHKQFAIGALGMGMGMYEVNVCAVALSSGSRWM